jgi:hypothetical protein
MSGFMLFFLVSCTEPSSFLFENHDFIEEHPSIEPIDDSLIQPTMITEFQDDIWLIDTESYLVHQYDSSGNPVSSYEFSDPPQNLTTNGSILLLSTETEVFQFESEIWSSVYTAEHIDILTTYQDKPVYVVNNEESSTIYIDEQSIEISVAQDDIYQHEDHWYFVNQDNQQLFEIIFDENLQNVDLQELHTFDDIPHQITSHNNVFYVTTRSFRWPYAGWIVGLSEQDGNWQEWKISETPPEPELILSYGEYVYWSSKQSLTRSDIDGGTFDMIASQTTVGGLTQSNDSIWWTDRKGGRLFKISK